MPFLNEIREQVLAYEGGLKLVRTDSVGAMGAPEVAVVAGNCEPQVLGEVVLTKPSLDPLDPTSNAPVFVPVVVQVLQGQKPNVGLSAAIAAGRIASVGNQDRLSVGLAVLTPTDCPAGTADMEEVPSVSGARPPMLDSQRFVEQAEGTLPVRHDQDSHPRDVSPGQLALRQGVPVSIGG